MCQIVPLVGEKQANESNNAVIACNDFLRLGPGRNIPKLLESYKQKETVISNFSAPSKSYSTLRAWSFKFKWPERETEFDADYEARVNQERAAEIDYGLSLDYERIKELKQLADLLRDQLLMRDADGNLYGLWVPDVKVVGHGDTAETVDIERFNSALVTQYRETLNDLAKETGGRVQVREITGKDGSDFVLKFEGIIGDDDND